MKNQLKKLIYSIWTNCAFKSIISFFDGEEQAIVSYEGWKRLEEIERNKFQNQNQQR